MTEIEFSTRYDALGIALPAPDKVCDGLCEGTGIIPYHRNDPDLKYNHKLRRQWREKHKECGDRKETWKAVFFFIKERQFRVAYHTLLDYKNWIKCDGWHFLKCPDCNGTGNKPQGRTG